MTQQELKDKILLAMYNRYKSGKTGAIRYEELCNEYEITYGTPEELSNAVDALNDEGFIKRTAFINNTGCIIDITATGIHCVEQYLLKREANNTDSSAGGETSNTSTEIHTATEINKNVVDADMSPCFGVEALAQCFAKQLDRVAFADHENVSMVGIFGPWGRGKTYFFSRVEDVLDDKYKVVRFSAWKYQNTPAIWAYLYETIYKSLSCCHKLGLWFREMWCIIWKPLLVSIVILGLIYAIGSKFGCSTDFSNAANILKDWGIPATVAGFIIYILNKMKSSVHSAYKLIEKYSHRKSYESYLGIQNEIERDLSILLKATVCPKKKRMLLYIDDIDRCTQQKMIEVVDSLRTILENEEIRKRLIVVCSVDAEKLKQGYKNAFKDVWDKSKADELAREQLDKLFIFSIGLSPLDNSQINDFIDNLVEKKKETTDADNNVTPYSTSRAVSSFVALRNNEQLTSVDETVLANWLKHSIEGKGELTPRKLRIIFYQLIFANNILARGRKNTIMLETTAQDIINKSLGEIEKVDTNVALSDVVDMVVPY